MAAREFAPPPEFADEEARFRAGFFVLASDGAARSMSVEPLFGLRRGLEGAAGEREAIMTGPRLPKDRRGSLRDRRIRIGASGVRSGQRSARYLSATGA
jgi:hypothetical protein